MANVNANVLTKQQATARNRVVKGAWVDQSNVDMIPEGGEFVALRNSTIRINQAMALGRSAQLVICAELAHIKSELDSLRDMNAKNGKKAFMESYDIRDYAETMFGLKKSQAYSLARVGERFLSDDGSLRREYVETLGNCGASVLGLLVNVDDESIVDMSNDLKGKLTAANIRAWNRALKAGKPDSSSERSETNEGASDSGKANEGASESGKANEGASESGKANEGASESGKANEWTSENDTMTFNETEDIPKLHVLLEVRDEITEIVSYDSEGAHHKVYATSVDINTILRDLKKLMKQQA